MELSSAIAIGIGSISLVLGIWNRVEQRHEFRVRQSARNPYLRGLFAVVTPDQEWHELQLVFYSPAGIGFKMHSIEILSPRSARLRSKGPKSGAVSQVGRKIVVDWPVASKSEPKGPASQCKIYCDPAGASELKLKVRASEISSVQARLTLLGKATKYVPSVKNPRSSLLAEIIAMG